MELLRDDVALPSSVRRAGRVLGVLLIGGLLGGGDGFGSGSAEQLGGARGRLRQAVFFLWLQFWVNRALQNTIDTGSFCNSVSLF